MATPHQLPVLVPSLGSRTTGRSRGRLLSAYWPPILFKLPSAARLPPALRPLGPSVATTSLYSGALLDAPSSPGSQSPSPVFSWRPYHWSPSWSPLQILDFLTLGAWVLCCCRHLPPPAQVPRFYLQCSLCPILVSCPLNVSSGMSRVCASGSPMAPPEHGFHLEPRPWWSLKGSHQSGPLVSWGLPWLF